MRLNFFLNQLGVCGIVANNILEVHEIFRINPGEFETYLAVAGTDYLPENINSRPHSGQKDRELTGFPGQQLFIYFQLTATNAKIDYSLNRVDCFAHSEPCPNIENNPAKSPFFCCHGFAPQYLLIYLSKRK